MADTRNRREIVSIGKWKPYTHSEHGEGAVREIRYIDGTIERRFAFHGTVPEGEQPDAGYVVDTKIDPELRKAWDDNKPKEPAAGSDPNDPKNRNEAELQRQREKNAALPADQDPAYETDDERRKRAQNRIDQQGKAAADAETRRRQQEQDARQARLDAESSATRASAERRAASQEARLAEEAKRPDTKVEKREIGGQLYLVSVTTPKDGSAPTLRYFGPDGAPVSRLPSEGEATAGGPKMPDIVAEQSETALIAYHRALASDPSLTPAQRAARFQEAVQIANVATKSAATQQLDRESRRNAEYNVATQQLSYLQTGMGQALEFASKLNATLPEGSDMGGRVFAALLGIQMLQMDRSGIGRVMENNPSAPRVPTLAPGDLTNPDKVKEANAAVAAAASPNALGLGAIGNQPAPTGAEVEAANRATQAGSQAAFAGAGIPPLVPEAASAPVSTAPPPPLTSPLQAPGDGPTIKVRDPWGNEFEVTQQQLDNRPGGSADLTPVAPAPQAAAPPTPDFPVLQAMATPTLAPAAPPPGGPGDFPVVTGQTVRDIPPWRMTEEDYRRHLANGGDESEFWSIPGVMV